MLICTLLLIPSVALVSAVLQVCASAETIRIENASSADVQYTIRCQQDSWSKTSFKLESNRYHTYSSSDPLVIMYWTDKQRLATLEPNRTYRLVDGRHGELRPVTSVLRPITPADPARDAPEAVTPAAGQPNPDSAPRRPEVRVIHVVALADNTYRRIVDSWQERIRAAVTAASEYYEPMFGLRFAVDGVRAWDYRGLTDKPAARWARLLQKSPGDADIVVAFIGFGDYYKGEDQAVYVGHLGQGMPFGQHVMVSAERYVHPNRDKAVLIHELAHLFGAFHVDEKRSIMQFNFRDVPTKDIIDGSLHMDEPLREIIRMTRGVDFRRGVASLDTELQNRVRLLCRTHRRAAERDAPDPIEQGYRYLKARKAIRAAATPDAAHGEAP